MEVYGDDGVGRELFQKTYEDNRWTNRSEVLRSKIGLDDVLATQSLVMQLLRDQSRSVFRGDKKHGFSLLNSIHSQQDELYDGSLEEYLACRVAKVRHDQWRMRIRFRQNELSEATRDNSYVDDFSFDWLRNGNVQAWYGNYLVKATPEGTYEAWQGIEPITPDMVAQLHDRMQLHVDQSVGAAALHNCRQMTGETGEDESR